MRTLLIVLGLVLSLSVFSQTQIAEVEIYMDTQKEYTDTVYYRTPYFENPYEVYYFIFENFVLMHEEESVIYAVRQIFARYRRLQEMQDSLLLEDKKRY